MGQQIHFVELTFYESLLGGEKHEQKYVEALSRVKVIVSLKKRPVRRRGRLELVEGSFPCIVRREEIMEALRADQKDAANYWGSFWKKRGLQEFVVKAIVVNIPPPRPTTT